MKYLLPRNENSFPSCACPLAINQRVWQHKITPTPNTYTAEGRSCVCVLVMGTVTSNHSPNMFFMFIHKPIGFKNHKPN